MFIPHFPADQPLILRIFSLSTYLRGDTYYGFEKPAPLLPSPNPLSINPLATRVLFLKYKSWSHCCLKPFNYFPLLQKQIQSLQYAWETGAKSFQSYLTLQFYGL